MFFVSWGVSSTAYCLELHILAISPSRSVPSIIRPYIALNSPDFFFTPNRPTWQLNILFLRISINLRTSCIEECDKIGASAMCYRHSSMFSCTFLKAPAISSMSFLLPRKSRCSNHIASYLQALSETGHFSSKAA